MKKRFKLGNLVLAVDTTPHRWHHEVLCSSIDRLSALATERNSVMLTTMIARKRQQLIDEEDRPLSKRRVCLHSRDWSWHVGWWKWLSFDWNISWIARKWGTTINPDGSQQGVPTYNEYSGILGYHCDL